MQDLDNLYLEHEQLITDKVASIKHVDLWYEQVSFLQEEQPFFAPAVFFAYRSNSMEDRGQKVQQVNLQVDVYFYFETFADTSRKSRSQEKGLNFLKILGEINSCFHGSNGQHYTAMRRTGFAPVETGTANLLYVQRYECNMVDDSAKVLSTTIELPEIDIQNAKPDVIAVNDEGETFTDIDIG